MKKLNQIIVMLLLLVGGFINAQSLTWTGKVDSDFFNELNYVYNVTQLPPPSGTIDPGVPITINTLLSGVTKPVIANGEISLGSAVYLELYNVTLKGTTINAIAPAPCVIGDNGYLELSSATPLLNQISVFLNSTQIGWLKLTNVTASLALSSLNSKIWIGGSNGVYGSTLRIDNYYKNGCIIRSINASKVPMILYSNKKLQGSVAGINNNTIYSAGAIPIGDNNLESFVLKKGYMATITTGSDGIGKSKVYIASESNLIVNELPATLQNTVSFIRVVPWNWVVKKGTNGATGYTNIGAGWRYDWNNNSTTNTLLEYTPMAWGYTNTFPAELTTMINKYGANHIMGFNEPDNTGQSGGYGGITNPTVGLSYGKDLQKIGIRVISPGCIEDGAFNYLKPYNDLARSGNNRMDVVAVHWSDWGNYQAGETGVTAQAIFNRFKIYLNKVYNYYGVPIWITEFNANPNRATALHEGFMALALPYLESLSYVERYCWFEPANNNANLYVNKDQNSEITTLGIIYRDQVSNPSVPEKGINGRNNLNLKF